MKRQQIGDVSIDLILENEGAFAAYDFVLPEATPDLIAENADWLQPRYLTGDGTIVMSFHGFVLRTGRHNILVDCCVGSDKERPLRPPWHRQKTPFLDNMIATGVRPEEIDFVLCTHLHADHVGWNTKLEDGRWVPTFPNAKYIFARDEYAYWEEEHRRARAEGGDPVNHGSFEDSVLPIVAANRAVMVDSDHEVDTGLWLEPAPGHTPGNVILNVARGGQRGVIVGDTIHTPVQLCKPSLSSRFCSDPAMSSKSRTALVEKVADTDTLFLTGHFPSPTAGRVVSHRNAFRFEVGE